MGSISRLIEGPFTSLSMNATGGLLPLPAQLTQGLTSQDMVRVIATRPAILTLEPGESLYFQGDPCRSIYVLLEGWAFSHQILEDGRRQILDFTLPGEIFGLPGAGILSHGVETLTPCVFSVLTRDRLQELMGDIPALAFRLVEVMAESKTRASEHLTGVGRRTASERVAHLLLELVTRLQDLSPMQNDTAWTLPLMLPHIADALGLTSETVCRVLSALRKKRILSLRGQRLEVIDERRLSAVAGISLETPVVDRTHATFSRTRILPEGLAVAS